MKKLIEKVKKLSLPVIIQLVIALLCTIAVPVFAWFAYQNRIEALSKIKEPPSINLASGGNDPALYITLENIDVTTSGNTKDVVFSVEPGKYQAYDLQLSHTTNIPFTYKLYRVKQDNNGTIEYTDHSGSEEVKLKYSEMTSVASADSSGKVTLTDINPDNNSTGRILGDEDVLATYAPSRRNYETEASGATPDVVNPYAKPLYSVARGISKLSNGDDGSDERDYFVIRITWNVNTNLNENSPNYWNYAFNNKETDIIYISAKQSTSS